jgi:hypothetical protein
MAVVILIVIIIAVVVIYMMYRAKHGHFCCFSSVRVKSRSIPNYLHYL